MYMKKTCAVLLVSFFSLFCLLSCGLEEFSYIGYIPNSDIDMKDTTRATIRMPSSSDEENGYSIDPSKKKFDYFIIFYRIYISDIPEKALIASSTDILIRSINTALISDYNFFFPITNQNSTSVTTSNLENTFQGRKYFKLELEDADISNVLGSGSLGTTVTIFFSDSNGVRPTLSINDGDPYTLLRDSLSIGNNASSVMRSRNFLNHPDLYNPDNAIPDVNADVAKDSKTNVEFRYTYVSMYIAAKGKVYNPLPQNIYSQPAFIGVFRLAESS